MKKINIITSTIVPLPIKNVDTDQIIPARFLKMTTRSGFGKNLFADWKKNKQFILNNHRYKGKILVAKKNFGCGSSREHAVWALVDYGFRVVVSSFFADIFKNNALNNGLLPIQIPPNIVDKLLKESLKNSNLVTIVDLNNQMLICPKLKIKEYFEIDQFKKKCLLNGYSDIDYLLSMKEKILSYEKKQK